MDFQEKCEIVLLEYYNSCNRPPSIRYNTEKIIKAITAVSGYDIAAVEVKEGHMQHLRGLLMTFESGADFGSFVEDRKHLEPHIKFDVSQSKKVALILLSSETYNNECWRRFTVIKEASHLFLEGDFLLEGTTNVAQLAKVLTDLKDASLNPQESNSSDEKVYSRDYMGVYAAMELLLPESAIRTWMTHEVNVRKQNSYQVASALKLPQKFVELRMVEWGLI